MNEVYYFTANFLKTYKSSFISSAISSDIKVADRILLYLKNLIIKMGYI